MVTGIKRPTVLWVLAGIALLAAVVLAIWLFDPPQRRIRLAAGPAESAEYHFAERYSAILKREGVQLELVATSGVLESLARLQDPKAGIDVALIEGGSTSAEKSPDLVSLGTLYYRPVWVFYRGDRMPPPGQPWPHTLRIALGPEGGDSANLSRRLLLETGADFDDGELPPPRSRGRRRLDSRPALSTSPRSWHRGARPRPAPAARRQHAPRRRSSAPGHAWPCILN